MRSVIFIVLIIGVNAAFGVASAEEIPVEFLTTAEATNYTETSTSHRSAPRRRGARCTWR
jgi:hypothetical protein